MRVLLMATNIKLLCQVEFFCKIMESKSNITQHIACCNDSGYSHPRQASECNESPVAGHESCSNTTEEHQNK